MKKIKIFLASSNELVDERLRFEIEIYRKCKVWIDEGIFLHLDVWEDLSTCMFANGSQSEYNEFVKSADLFVLLAYTKVGIYTAEEFENAIGQFKATQKPFIFTYFKTIPINSVNNTPEIESLQSFKQKLIELKHFYTNFKDFYHLWNQFNKELERLVKVDFVKHEPIVRIDTSLGLFSDRRKQGILKRLDRIYQLIDEYENKLLTINDPKEKMRVEQELEILVKQMKSTETEYKDLN
jgi:hypothetical protein